MKNRAGSVSLKEADSRTSEEGMTEKQSGPAEVGNGRSGQMLAIFPVAQYLSDASLRQVVVDIVKGSTDVEKVVDRPTLLPFHPLGAEDLKQKRDVDAYALLLFQGIFVRTHVVVANGLSHTNPPPEGYVCDSCHARGWLRKDYQDSKLDGANIPVWLCPDCSKLEPEERNVRF